MTPRPFPRCVFLFVWLFAALLAPAAVHAQVTPAAGYTPPDDTPSIKVGATIFTDYTYNKDPLIKDNDGNSIHGDGFNVSRAYINITGNISHMIAFRITPDVTRENFTGLTPAPGLSGSLVFRLKYAFAQFNLDDWMTHGSWVRFGLQQTPFVDYTESIYRYRFQGTTFAEREGFLTSSDAGVSFHYNFSKNFGDVHAGYYNGDGYSKAEANNQQAFQIRGTLRPFATAKPALRGLRLTGFYDNDNYIKSDEKTRAIFETTYEHKYLNAGYDYMHTTDQPTNAVPVLTGDGYSFWLTPKSSVGLEGLFRYDHFTPSDQFGNRDRERTIVGVAYWFKHQGTVSTAIMLDYDDAKFNRLVPVLARQTKIALHGLVNF
ncbi:MAG TPA: hypothetical protein VJ260_10750 [Vicinamibacterales bacterium]|nr:hypothetical protein [Vicinamibacterales bacterium]